MEVSSPRRVKPAMWCRCRLKQWSLKPACCNCGAWRATDGAGSWNSTCGSGFKLNERRHRLGTTNSALACIDSASRRTGRLSRAPDFRDSASSRAGRVEARRTLPSFLYSRRQELRWALYAREQGAMVPTGWCTRRNRGCRIRKWTARRRFCRGMRRRAGACFRRWRFRRDSGAHSRGLGQSSSGCAAGRAGHRAHGAGVLRRRSARTDGEAAREPGWRS